MTRIEKAILGTRSNVPCQVSGCSGWLIWARDDAGRAMQKCENWPKCRGHRNPRSTDQPNVTQTTKQGVADLNKGVPAVPAKEEGKVLSPASLNEILPQVREAMNTELRYLTQRHVNEISTEVERKVRREVGANLPQDIKRAVSTEVVAKSNEFRASMQGTLDEMFKKLQSRVDNLPPKVHEWRDGDKLIARVEGKTHQALHTVMSRFRASMKNILLVGPAGSGKTTLAGNLASGLKLEFAHISCSGGMPEWQLTGRSMPVLTTGEEKYHPSDFIRLYENGGVYLLDEVDSADANVLIIINSALANGYLSVPARKDKPVAKRHKDFYLLAAANTYGNGATMQYVGRNQLDAAFLDRFVGAVITMDYDRELERHLCPDTAITSRIWEMREKVAANKIRRVVGTRALQAVYALKTSGMSLKEAFDAIVVGWTDDEKSKVMPRFF